MSIKSVEDLLTKGGKDEDFRHKYNVAKDVDEFVRLAAIDGFEFTGEELLKVINESGDSFDSYGNPRKRSIWW